MDGRADRGALAASLGMAAAALVFVGPLCFMVSSSLKPDHQIFSDLRSARAFLPVGEISLENYRSVLAQSNLPRYLFNSILISLSTVALGVVVNSMAAFGLQRLTWRGQGALVGLVLALLVVPFELTALPLMLIVSRVPGLGIEDGILVWTASWFDTFYVQVVPFAGNAFSIFLFHQMFKDIPHELDEAAQMDGAGWFTIYARVVMPNAGPAVGTSAIVLFLAMWNQYLWPTLVVPSETWRPVMVGLQQFFGPENAWGEIMAYATLITLPVLTVFVLFQRQFVQSVARAGLKG